MKRQKIDLNFGHLMPKKEGKKPGESSFNNAKPPCEMERAVSPSQHKS